MGTINIEGLGKPVQIQGDEPTREEAQVILRAVEAQGGLPADREPGDLDVGVQPQSLQELTGGFASRPAFTAVGGVTGGAVGAAAGAAAGGIGAIPGAIAGGALGTMAGEFAFDTTEQVARFFGLIEGELDPLETRLMRAGKSATEDIAFTAGTMGLGQSLKLIRPAIGKVLGVRTEAARKIMQEANDLGMRVGAVDVAPGVRGRILKGTAGVFGMFPYIGAPFRGAAVDKAGDILRVAENTIDAFAPAATMSDDLGIDMVRAAKGVRKEFTLTAARLYDNLRSVSRALDVPEIVPTKNIKKVVGDFVEEVRLQQTELLPTKEQLAELRPVLTGPLGSPAREATEAAGKQLSDVPAANALHDFLQDVQRFPELITMDQLQGLSLKLRRFVKAAAAEGFDVAQVSGVKKSMEEAVTELRFAGKEGDEAVAGVIAARDAANGFFSENILKFKTPTAQKFTRVDRNIFRAGVDTPGSIDADQMGEVLLRLKTPQAVDDLSALVGKDNMKAAGRNWLEKHWENALLTNSKTGDVEGINFSTLGKITGLTSRVGPEKAAAKKIFENAGVDVEAFVKFIDVAQNIKVPASVNTFIARRAALGGLGAAIGGATVPGVLKTGFSKAFVVALALRRGVRLISSPEDLKAMVEIMAPTTKEQTRRRLLGQLLENIGRTEEEEETRFAQQKEEAMSRQQAEDPASEVFESASP